jgi:heme A synthase
MVLHHFSAMTLFAFLVSVVFATLNKETPRQKVLYGTKCFVVFMIVAIALGWLMYPFPHH